MALNDKRMVILKRGPRNIAVTPGRCSKLGHKSKAKANKKIRTWGRRRGCCSVYLCPHCKLWHTTSMKQENQDADE